MGAAMMSTVLTVLESSPSPAGKRAQFIARLTARIVTSDGPVRQASGIIADDGDATLLTRPVRNSSLGKPPSIALI